jgi:magnesium transporter
MDLETTLACDLLAAHPIDAARAFERLPARDVASLLEALGDGAGVRALQHMATASAAAVVAELPEARAGELFERMPAETAALLLRQTEVSARERVLAALPARRARELGSILAFPEGTAGALMDPEVLALPQDLDAEEALERVRQAAGHARYNVYIVDREQLLVGVISLRELLMAGSGERLSSRMVTAVHRLAARADRHAIVTHPGWREVHSLPVVDARGRYLGALRYRTLRQLQEGLRDRPTEEGATARALGDLFRAGASAMLEAVVASAPAEHEAARAGGRR